MHGKERCRDRSASVAPDDEPPSIAIVYRIAGHLGREPTELPPLADSVDPEAIDAIFDGRRAEDTVLTFSHAGCDIEVSAEEVVITRR